MTKQYANRLSLMAFLAAVARGLPPFGSGRDFTGTLEGALLTAAVFFGIGLIFGELGRRLAEEAGRNDAIRALEETAAAE